MAFEHCENRDAGCSDEVDDPVVFEDDLSNVGAVDFGNHPSRRGKSAILSAVSKRRWAHLAARRVAVHVVDGSGEENSG